MAAPSANNQFLFLQSQKNRVHLILKTGEHYEGILENIDIQSNKITLGQLQQIQPLKELQEKSKQPGQPTQPQTQPQEEKVDSNEESEEEEEEEEEKNVGYQNKNSFFDNISTSATHPMSMQNAKQLDQETFGADYFKIQRPRGRRPRRNNYNNNQRNYNQREEQQQFQQQQQTSAPNAWVLKRQQYRKDQEQNEEEVVEPVHKQFERMTFDNQDDNEQQQYENDNQEEFSQPFAIANRYNNQGRRNFRGQRGGNRRGGYRRNQFRGRGRGFTQEFD